jgi:thiamine-monophosphate kinase
MSPRASLISENQLIRKISQISSQSSSQSDRLQLSIGDDAAAFRSRKGVLTLISTDALLEGIHFDLKYFSPEDLGWKALAVNLSDIAAMGGESLYFTTSIALPREKSAPFVQKLYRGMLQLANKAQITLIGGDTCASPGGVFLNVTIIGEVRPSEIVRRRGAQAGDLVFVTGELGGSAIGLELLRSHPELARASRRLTERHLRPVPRCHIGRFLAARQYASAMIDISDGLSTDLHHLCEQSQVGALIDAAKLPLSKVSQKATSLLSKALLDYGMNGGEDYELLFTASPKIKDKVPKKIQGVSIQEIGQITEEAGFCRVSLHGRVRRLFPSGFDHFAAL